MKTRLVIGVLLLIGVILGSVYFKELILMSAPFFNARYVDMAIVILIALIVTYIITKIVDILFLNAFKKFLKQDSIAKKLLPLLHNIVIIIVWIFSIVTTIDLLGFNMTTLLTSAGIGGVIFALAGKEAASNLLGSLSLIFSRSFKPGDVIRIKGMEGTVEEITLSYTRLTDKRGNIIYIPNKNIIVESIENLSQGKHRKNEIIFPISVNTSSKEMDSLLKSLEKYGEKKKKDGIFDEFKITFDSLTATSQNISFMFKSNAKSHPKIKMDTYLDIKDIMDSQKIVFA